MAFVENPMANLKDFGAIVEDVNNNFHILNTTRAEIIIGTYVGNSPVEVYDDRGYIIQNATSSRVIDLGFTPIMVELYSPNQDLWISAYSRGYSSTAVDGMCSCIPDKEIKILEIVNGGFKVYNYCFSASETLKSAANRIDTKYIFKAYKNINGNGVQEYN